jgi:hypothetical protein
LNSVCVGGKIDSTPLSAARSDSTPQRLSISANQPVSKSDFTAEKQKDFAAIAAIAAVLHKYFFGDFCSNLPLASN